MENNNNNSSNSLVFGRWPQTKTTTRVIPRSLSDGCSQKVTKLTHHKNLHFFSSGLDQVASTTRSSRSEEDRRRFEPRSGQAVVGRRSRDRNVRRSNRTRFTTSRTNSSFLDQKKAGTFKKKKFFFFSPNLKHPKMCLCMSIRERENSRYTKRPTDTV